MSKGRNEYHQRDNQIKAILENLDITLDDKINDIAWVQYGSIHDFSDYIIKHYKDRVRYYKLIDFDESYAKQLDAIVNSLEIMMPKILLDFISDLEKM